ncbi:MAG: DUF167 domain-containing protein [Candidatus Paceibacterota bacterium]
MKIFVKVKAGKQIDSLEDLGDNNFIISVRARPVKGEANQAVTKILAEYFKISRSRVSLLSGAVSKIKVFDIWPVDDPLNKKRRNP